MSDQDTPYDAIIRAEIATEFINQARAIAMARIYELEAQDPDGARGPAPVRVELLDLHSSQCDAVEKRHRGMGATRQGRSPLLAGVLIMAEAAGSGLLSPDRNESIFRNDIIRDYFPDDMGRADRPRPIGQLGADEGNDVLFQPGTCRI